MACVAFRGTEQGKWQDILTDLHLVPAPLDPESVAAAPRNAALAEVSQSPDEPGRLRQILSAVEQAKQRQGKEGQVLYGHRVWLNWECLGLLLLSLCMPAGRGTGSHCRCGDERGAQHSTGAHGGPSPCAAGAGGWG